MADRWAGRLMIVVAVVATIGCDRVTKHVASTSLADSPASSFLGDTVRIGYVENTGGFLSLGAALPQGIRTAIFTAATGLLLLVLTVVAVRRRLKGWAALGIALFVAGGTSNWIDRVTHGAVVDFLNVGIGPLRTGVFNVADVSIMLGLAVFLVSQHRSRPAAAP
jgi:signal peptidase II